MRELPAGLGKFPDLKSKFPVRPKEFPALLIREFFEKDKLLGPFRCSKHTDRGHYCEISLYFP